MSEDDQEQRFQTLCLFILTTIAVGAALYYLRGIMIPFVVALFFSIALSPGVEFQIRRLHLPRALALLTTLVLLFVVMSFVMGLVTTSLGQLTANSAAYQAKIVQIIDDVRIALPLEQLGIEIEDATFDPLTAISAKTVGSLLLVTTNAILDLLSQSFIVLIFTFFLLAGGSAPRDRDGDMRSEVELRINNFIVKQGAISAATGLLVGSTLWLLGVDLAMVFGLFAFMLNFIPSIGSVIATLLPLPVVLVSPDLSSTQVVLAIAIPGTLQFLIGNVISPKIMGDALELHPITVLLSLMFWGALWGIVGMLLATPITAIIKMMLDRFEVTAPLGTFLAGRRPEALEADSAIE
jgi:AI-2 transport protein TqsA